MAVQSVQLPEINLIPLLPEIFIAVMAMGLLLLDAWRGREGRGTTGVIALVTVVLAAVILYSLDPGGDREASIRVLSGFFVTDAFSTVMKMLMCVATFLALLISWDYLNRHNLNSGEYFVLTLFALMGGMIIASSGDFLSLYLGIELMSLSIYVLAAFRRDHLSSNEAGLKYFILGSMASGMMLYGITLVYGTTGSTNFLDVKTALLTSDHLGLAVTVGLILILSGLCFKVAAAPFHMWAPDVYQGAPTSVTAFMAVMPKLAAFAAIYRILLEPFIALQVQWSAILQILALASLAVGSFAAIAQSNIKRMLAYSSIGHVGYALIGLAAGTELGYQSVVVYLTIYLFMNIGSFALVLILNRDEATGEEIEDFKGLGHKRPLLAFMMLIFMFSMTGLPPLAGFIGKLQVFMAAVEAGLIPLAIAGVLFSAVGAYYYLRIVKLMYFDAPEAAFTMPVGMSLKAVVGISGFLVLVWGIFPGALTAWARASVQTFL